MIRTGITACRAIARRFRSDVRGAYVVELAFVMAPLSILLLVFTDFGYRMYLESVVEGTVNRAARLATVGNKTSDQIDQYVRDQLHSFSRTATVSIDKSNYYEFSGVGKPEKITSDTSPFGVYNAGDCYEDLNGNGQWDANAGRTGLGGSDDIVYYTVTATFNRIVPLSRFLGFSATDTVTSKTVMRNQPYASQTIPTIKCS
jgi:Flp pilus assembly protein TadG